jgi:hypothetical protein
VSGARCFEGTETKEVDRMRDMLKRASWRHVLYTAASLATLLLAAGARWKPK